MGPAGERRELRHDALDRRELLLQRLRDGLRVRHGRVVVRRRGRDVVRVVLVHRGHGPAADLELLATSDARFARVVLLRTTSGSAPTSPAGEDDAEDDRDDDEPDAVDDLGDDAVVRGEDGTDGVSVTVTVPSPADVPDLVGSAARSARPRAPPHRPPPGRSRRCAGAAAAGPAGARSGHGGDAGADRAAWSDLDSEAPGRTLTLAAGPQPAQSLHQHRVGRQGGRRVDQGIEHLVVPRRGHVEQLTDGLFLGAGVLPPLPLEGEDLAVAAGQAVRTPFVDCPARIGRGVVRALSSAAAVACPCVAAPSFAFAFRHRTQRPR